MIKILILAAVQLCSLFSFAGIAQNYGSSPTTMALSAQANNNTNDPANNYYAPSMMGYENETAFSFNQSALIYDFKDINDVVILNKSNSELSTPRSGSSDINYESSYIFSGHMRTSLIKKLNLNFTFSFYAPINKLIHTNTGDAFEPNYVFYSRRNERTQLEFNIVHRHQDYSFSLGSFVGQQAAGESKLITRETADPDFPYSSGQAEFNVKPSAALILSMSKKNDKSLSYITIRQEMQSKMQIDSYVQNPIGGASGFAFEFEVKSLMYFDPLTIILGHHFQFNQYKILASLQYERWSHFRSPKLELKKKFGAAFNGSNDLEELNPEDTFTPKLGFEYHGNHHTYQFAYSYQASPLNNNLDEVGNTIDLNKHIVSMGIIKPLSYLGFDFTFNMALQAHLLESKSINKTPNDEIGNAGSKIGSPGYEAGGQVYALGIGLSWINL